MFINPQYFLVLSRSKSISEAADTLHVSHQNLSKYLQNLEKQYGVTLFARSPRLQLTEAGRILLDSLREQSVLEENLQSRLAEVRQSRAGTLRIGVPEGRARLAFPQALARLKKQYPLVKVELTVAPSYRLQTLLLENAIDLALMDKLYADLTKFACRPVMTEELYLVVTEQLLREYFPESYPQCLVHFRKGVALEQAARLPFILNRKNSISRQFLDHYLTAHNLQLEVLMELSQIDLQILLSARNYGASLCWSMYLSMVADQNQLHPANPVYAFPLKDIDAHNYVVLAALKNRVLPSYSRVFLHLLQEEYRDTPWG